MTEEFDTHKHAALEREIIFLMNSWNLDDGHDGYIVIYYCPYCGVKLE